MNTAIAQLKPYLSRNKEKLNTFKPSLMCKHYQVEARQTNHVNVIRLTYLKSKRADWYFRVHRRNVDILFLALNENNQLVILDSKNNIYLYDCEHQVCLSHQRLNSRDDLRIQCNQDYLYILTDCEIYAEGDEPEDYTPRTNTLYQFDYHKFSIKHQIRVDDDYELFSNTPNKDEELGYSLEKNKLYFYCSDYALGKRDHAGLVTVDFNRSKRQELVSEGCFETQHKYSTYRIPPIFISLQYQLGIRPNYINPSFVKPGITTTNSTQPNSEPILHTLSQGKLQEYIPYNIEIFDINTGNNITKLEVRQFTKFELEEEKTGLVMELLKSAEAFKKYNIVMERINEGASYSKPEFPDRSLSKPFDRFYNKLRNITFYPNLSKDIKSNLGITKKSIGFILQFKYDEFINVDISSSKINVTPLTTEQSHCFEMDLSHSQSDHDSQISDNQIKANQEKEKKHPFIPPEKLISNIIEIPQWDLPNAKNALQQYLGLVHRDIKALIIDHEINIYIRIGYNSHSKQYLAKYDDKSFFTKLAEFGADVAPELIELINWFCQYPNSEELYHDVEASFLSYAMKHLLGLGEQYQPLYLRYLAGVDMDHDVINCEMCGDILLNDEWSENKLKFVIAMRSLGGQHFHNELFDRWPGALEEYTMKHHDTASLATLLEQVYLDDPDYMDEILLEIYSEPHKHSSLIKAFHLLQKKHAITEAPSEIES